jgi:hypothetical protein
VLTVDDDAVKTGQGNHLGLADRGDGHESHERVLSIAELVEETQTGVLDSGCVGGWVGDAIGDGHFDGVEAAGTGGGAGKKRAVLPEVRS